MELSPVVDCLGADDASPGFSDSLVAPGLLVFVVAPLLAVGAVPVVLPDTEASFVRFPSFVFGFSDPSLAEPVEAALLDVAVLSEDAAEGELLPVAAGVAFVDAVTAAVDPSAALCVPELLPGMSESNVVNVEGRARCFLAPLAPVAGAVDLVVPRSDTGDAPPKALSYTASFTAVAVFINCLARRGCSATFDLYLSSQLISVSAVSSSYLCGAAHGVPAVVLGADEALFPLVGLVSLVDNAEAVSFDCSAPPSSSGFFPSLRGGRSMRPFVARAVAVVPCVFVGDFGAAGGVAAATDEAGRVGSCAVVLSLGEPVVPLG